MEETADYNQFNHFSSSNTIPHNHNNFGCDCMEYWTCILVSIKNPIDQMLQKNKEMLNTELIYDNSRLQLFVLIILLLFIEWWFPLFILWR